MWKGAPSVFLQALLALVHCEQNGIVHGDLRRAPGMGVGGSGEYDFRVWWIRPEFKTPTPQTWNPNKYGLFARACSGSGREEKGE